MVVGTPRTPVYTKYIVVRESTMVVGTPRTPVYTKYIAVPYSIGIEGMIIL